MFAGLSDAVLDDSEPLVGEVLRMESAAGMHEKATDALSVHQVDLMAAFVRLKLVVPAPEWDWAIVVGRGERLLEYVLRHRVVEWVVYGTVQVA